MKYFTRNWLKGGVSDDESNAVFSAYRTRLDSILPLMPPTVQELAKNISIHDGIVERFVLDRHAESLRFELLCGDMQKGYFGLQLTYGCAKVDRLELAAIAREPATEALYDEVDVLPGGFFEHRILFTHTREISIVFRTLHLTRATHRSDASQCGRAIRRELKRFII